MTPRANRREGVFVPPEEVEIHLHNGWTIIDDLADARVFDRGRDLVLMAPPVCFTEAA